LGVFFGKQENGVEILKIPGAGHTDILETENNGRKFLLFSELFSTDFLTVWISGVNVWQIG